MKKILPVLGLAAALVLSACSGSGGEPELTGTKATGAPIVLGAQAPLRGASAYPQSGYGIEAAEYYINEVLGGIHGRPIDVDVCEGDGSPETAINCANGFVSKKVPLVVDTVDQSMGAAVPILGAANIPIVGTLAGSFQADTAGYGKAFYFTGPISFASLSTASLFHSLGKKSASLAVNEAPTSHAYIDNTFKPIAKNLGIDVKVQYPPAVGANLNVIAATQIADKPDVAGVVALPEDSCTQLFTALRRQGFDGMILAGSCSQFIDQMGAQGAGIVTQPRLWMPRSKNAAPPKVQEELTVFEQSMKAVGHEDEVSSRSMYPFATLVNIAKILNASGGTEVTAQAVTDALKQVKDFESFAGPKLTCDGKQWPGVATTCNAQAIFFELNEDGTLKPVHDSGYTNLDLTALPPA